MYIKQVGSKLAATHLTFAISRSPLSSGSNPQVFAISETFGVFQVIIHGFKSYREQTIVEPFDRRHNVVGEYFDLKLICTLSLCKRESCTPSVWGKYLCFPIDLQTIYLYNNYV